MEKKGWISFQGHVFRAGNFSRMPQHLSSQPFTPGENCTPPALDFLTEMEIGVAAKPDIKATASLTSSGRGGRSEIKNIGLKTSQVHLSPPLF